MSNYYAFLPLLVGALIPVQAKLNGKLFSLNQNAIFTSLISVIISCCIILMVHLSTTKDLPLVKAPWWVYTGGAIGAVYLVGLAWVAAKVSTTQLIAGLLGGQMIMALFIDYFMNGRLNINQLVSAGLVLVAVLIKK